MRSVSKEFVRFLLAGVANTGATYFLYLLLLAFLPYLVAYTVSYVAGMAISYWLNLMFVFEKKFASASPRLFVLVYLTQYGCSAGLLWFFVSVLNIPAEIGLLLAICLMVPATYLGLRWVFNRNAG